MDEYRFVMYVLGSGVEGRRALANLTRIAERYLKGKYKIDIVDLQQDIAQAEDAEIFAVPTTDKQAPQPVVRLVGDLSDAEVVIEQLALGRQSSDVESEG